MKKQFLFSVSLVVLLILALFLAKRAQAVEQGAPLTTAFTYQGRLKADGAPVEGANDFTFRLYDSATDGELLAGELHVEDVAVREGVFSVLLDFGNVFNGQERWLEVSVRPGDSAGAYTTLAPRQLLTAAPYAAFSLASNWSGLRDIPAGFADGSDNDTLYSAGTGLLLDGTFFTVDTGYVQRRVSTGCAVGAAIREILADGSVACQSMPSYQAGSGLVLSDTTFSVDSSQVQLRISGSCAVGSTIRQINADGSVECQAFAPAPRLEPPASHLAAVLDASMEAGDSLSVTLGVDGLGLISYLDNTNGHLKVAHCNDPACSSATTYTLDSAPNVGFFSSITIGTDGLGLISYYDSENGNLKVAHCSNLECSGAGKFTLDSNGDVGWYTSITIGGDGLGLISYHDDTNGSLKVAHCNNTLCSSATTYTLANNSLVGWDTAITLGADQRGLISFADVLNGDLKVAHCNDLLCSSAALSTLDSAGNVGWQSAVTTGSDGLGLISYYDETNGDLKIAHCQDLTCSNASVITLDSQGVVGSYSSITVGADGLGLISYYDQTNSDLKIAHCGDIPCSYGISVNYPSAATIGHPTAVTIGVDGLPLVVTVNMSTGDLLALHCHNALCADYFRRR